MKACVARLQPKQLRKLVVAGVLVAAPVLSQAETLVVMTSYPQEVMSLFEDAFETQYPETDLRFEWRRSADARNLLETSAQAGVDVYWAPSLGNFVSLADAGYFRTLDADRKNLPGQIGDLVIDDPAQRFAAFEVAGFGFVFNLQQLEHHQLPIPQDWPDLAAAHFRGHLVLPVPSRVGFSPMIYESILAGYGWETGWPLITAMAANGDLLQGGPVNMIEDVARGTWLVAPSIDFFPLSAQAGGTDISFRYADTTLLSPAYIGILEKAEHPQEAQQFVDFALSETGQTLLLNPEVTRLPVRPSAYSKAPEYNPFTDSRHIPAYDFREAASRETLLALLFDLQITERHAELTELITRIDTLAAGSDSRLKMQAAQARRLLLTMPVAAEEMKSLIADMQNGMEVLSEDKIASWRLQIQQRTQQARQQLQAVVSAAGN